MVFNAIKFQKIEFLYSNLSNLAFSHNYQTRSQGSTFRIPQPAVDTYRFNFLYRAVKEWNDLPLEIRNIDNLPQFKKKLIARMISQY